MRVEVHLYPEEEDGFAVIKHRGEEAETTEFGAEEAAETNEDLSAAGVQVVEDDNLFALAEAELAAQAATEPDVEVAESNEDPPTDEAEQAAETAPEQDAESADAEQAPVEPAPEGDEPEEEPSLVV